MSYFPETVVSRDPQTHLCHYDFSAYRAHLRHCWVESLDRYFNQGIEPGGFIRAVLENDLQGAVRRCSPLDCIGEVQGLLDLLVEGAPSRAWGDKTAVAVWLSLWGEGGVYQRPVEAAHVEVVA